MILRQEYNQKTRSFKMQSSKKQRYSNKNHIFQKSLIMISTYYFVMPAFVYATPPCSLEQVVHTSQNHQNQPQKIKKNISSSLLNSSLENLINSFNSNKKDLSNHQQNQKQIVVSNQPKINLSPEKTTQEANQEVDQESTNQENHPCSLELKVGNFKLESGELAPESFQMIKSQIQMISQNCIQQTNPTIKNSLRGFFWVSVEPTEKYQWQVDIPIASALKEEQLTTCLKAEIKKLVDAQNIDFNQEVFVSIHVKRH